MSVSTGDLRTRIYDDFRGVDFRGGEVSLHRSPDSLNMWKDYKVSDSIRTRPALQYFLTFGGNIHSISFYKDMVMVHAGKCLYTVNGEQKVMLREGLNDAKSNTFIYGEKWYFMDGIHYLCYDGTDLKEVEGFVPTTSIARNPKGGGTMYQAVNMLSPYRINTFVANGVKVKKQPAEGPEYWAYEGDYDYYLDAKWEEGQAEVEVYINDRPIPNDDEEYPWLATTPGVVSFVKDHSPLAPLTEGQANVEIKFKVDVEGHKEMVTDCNLVQLFDNRVFISGNANYPNAVWHSGLNDPTYFPDTSYMKEGLDEAKVKALVASNDKLWVFREPSQTNTSVFYHTPTTDESGQRVYPSRHSGVATGCIGTAVNFNDDVVFFSARGMEGITSDIALEQMLAHRSTLVDARMLAEQAYADMVLAEWEGYLLIFIGSHVYVADSRSVFNNNGHVEYDFFYWELENNVTAVAEKDGVLYIGATDSVYVLSDSKDDEQVVCYWVTTKDRFGEANKSKTTNKKGCVVRAEGDLAVYVKVDDGDFELVNEQEGVTDRFNCRIKKKKWSEIQLKIQSASEKGFSLDSATLEAYVGGYLK